MTLRLDQPLSGKTLADIHQLETGIDKAADRDSFARFAEINGQAKTAAEGYEGVLFTGEAYTALGALGEGVVGSEVMGVLSVGVVGLGVVSGLALAVGLVGLTAAIYNAATSGKADESMEDLNKLATFLSPTKALVYGAGYAFGGTEGAETAATVNEAREDLLNLLEAIVKGEYDEAARAAMMFVKDAEKLTGLDVPGASGLGEQKEGDIPADQIFGGNDFVPKSDPMSNVEPPGADIDRNSDDDDRDDEDRDDEDRDDEDRGGRDDF